MALQKLCAAEDGWNTRDPRCILLAYTTDSYWRKRSEFVSDQQEIVAFLIRKWAKELGGRLMRGLWAWSGAKTAIRFAFEWHRQHGAMADAGRRKRSAQ